MKPLFKCEYCGCKFDSIELLERENRIAEQSDEQYEIEELGAKE